MRSRRVPYIVCFALSLPLVLLWALATPVMAVVDDPAHIDAAAAAVRGEFHQPSMNTGIGDQEMLRVPGKLAALTHVADCLVQGPDIVPTDCQKPTITTDAPVKEPSTAIRYPPLFYWLAGWSTLLLSGLGAYWGVTITAAIINSALLALGLWALVNFGRRMVIVGWLVCLTPEVLYIAGSANDSGFEIAAALASWACLWSLIAFEEPPLPLVAATTIATSTFVLARPASPLWVLLMFLAVAVVAGWKRVHSYLRQRRIRFAIATICAAVVASEAWRLVVGTPSLLYVTQPHPTGLKNAIRISLFNLDGILQSQIGVWLNTLVPLSSLLLWLGVFAILLLGGLAFAPRRWLIPMVGLLIGVFAIPIFANVIEFNKLGIWWQGRDSLPINVGLPMLLGLAIPESLIQFQPARRVLGIGIVVVGVLNEIAFVWILHRYTIGEDGSWHPSKFLWQPPGGFLLLVTLFTVSCLGLCLAIRRWVISERSPVSASPVSLAPFNPSELEQGQPEVRSASPDGEAATPLTGLSSESSGLISSAEP